jgi:hypothetical protein
VHAFSSLYYTDGWTSEKGEREETDDGIIDYSCT